MVCGVLDYISEKLASIPMSWGAFVVIVIGVFCLGALVRTSLMWNKRNIIIILVVLCIALSTIYLWSGVIGPEIHKLKEHRGEDEVWNILGTVIRNVSGILTFVTAVFTACVLIYTNNTRAREAVNSEYRDQMQWACETLT